MPADSPSSSSPGSPAQAAKAVAIATGLFAAAALFLILGGFLILGFLAPRLSTEARLSDPDLVREVEALRAAGEPSSDSVVRSVDYSEGPLAPWFPSGQAPALEELAQSGKLPPVADRVGSEPLVLQGVDGAGEYGGSWFQTFTSHDDINSFYLSVCLPVFARWSPEGYPVRPNLLRNWTFNADKSVWDLHLRRGIRWSDGAPATADDILFAYEDALIRHPDTPPDFLRTDQGYGTMEKVDALTVRVTFPSPKPDFDEVLTQQAFIAPQHYLRPRHPLLGDPALVAGEMLRWGLHSRQEFYNHIRKWDNPELPALGPWIYREYKGGAPQILVRNPYYWAVDGSGRQLPYLDRVVCNIKDARMVAFDAAAGDVTFQNRHIDIADYPLYVATMRQRGYEVLHWRASIGGPLCIYPNLNLRVPPGNREAQWKKDYLNKADFRKALSLAINRQVIIDAELNGFGEPAQAAPAPGSPFFNEELYKADTKFDPSAANALLDAIGLEKRDAEGFRIFPDGTPATFRLSYSAGPPGALEFLKNDLQNVGLRTVVNYQAKTLAAVRKRALENELFVAAAMEVENPILRPDMFVPVNAISNWAPGFGGWYLAGGLFGKTPESPADIEPPPGSPVREAMQLYVQACSQPEATERAATFQRIFDLARENLWTINVSSAPPALWIKSRDLRNVPRHAATSFIYRTPLNVGPETFFHGTAEKRDDGSSAAIRRAMTEIALPPFAAAATSGDSAGSGDSRKANAASWVWRALLILIAGGILWTAVRYPYIGRRILLMIPTLLIISLVGFLIFKLPPGNFVDSKRAYYEMQGDTNSLRELDELIAIHHLDSPAMVQYAHWLGLPWFLSFQDEDRGLLQGFLGRRMEDGRPVNDLIGENLALTVALSFFTILFTYAVALPIGVYSACRQYSPGDYLFTIIGFLGMSIPNFLLAVVLIYIGNVYFHVNLTGLFSPEYALQPQWSFGKFVDLLKHIWIPVVVIGAAGTAGLIRVMRANLLDELKKPYVVTARAKGVRPLSLLLRYPIRIAINPFISNIGHLFPSLLSGGGLVSIVMGLPTIGPLMLYAIINEDFYFASSLLMIFSALGVMGTLVSDLLLLAIDPRIRMERKAR